MLKNPFSFEGRIGRAEYGISLVMYAICYFTAITFINTGNATEGLLSFIILMPMLWFILAQGAKRCHGLGKSGWFQIIPFYFLWLLFVKSDHATNEYDTNSKSTPVVKATKDNAPDSAPPGTSDLRRR